MKKSETDANTIDQYEQQITTFQNEICTNLLHQEEKLSDLKENYEVWAEISNQVKLVCHKNRSINIETGALTLTTNFENMISETL